MAWQMRRLSDVPCEQRVMLGALQLGQKEADGGRQA